MKCLGKRKPSGSSRSRNGVAQSPKVPLQWRASRPQNTPTRTVAAMTAALPPQSQAAMPSGETGDQGDVETEKQQRPQERDHPPGPPKAWANGTVSVCC
jgi:hypothetical protein